MTVAEMTLSTAVMTVTEKTGTVMIGTAGTTSTGTLVVVDGLTLLPAAMSGQGLREGMTIGAVAVTMVMKGVVTIGGAMTGKRSARTKGRRGRPTVIKYG